ncbi:MAG: peptidoglycan bridge formation glycyltransferase FemA/FemB family protein [bacterium]|nr:peptidoglycan bridge formation glycyltransferase FemA/FemB family protein [bacterium]
MISFLQSKDWFNFQKSQGRPVFFYDQGGVQTGIIRLPLPFKKSYLYIPHGPEMDFNQMTGGIDNEVMNFIRYLKKLAKEEKAIFIKTEPLNDSVAQFLAKNKFKRSKKEIQPAKTVILDLTQIEDQLLDRLHYKTRYNIKVAEKNDVVIHIPGPTWDVDNLDLFWKLMKKTAKRDKFSSHSKDYYKKLLNFFGGASEIKTKLFLAYHQDKPVAGLVLLMYKGTGYYLHGASDYDYRHLMAPYLLHWSVIKFLKQEGFENYDMWGIDPRHWPGVTRFKLGWGGRTVERPGSFDRTTSWWWHMAYKLGRKIF